MKRINKLAASIAVVLSLGVVSQANALIELEASSTGDALLFPVFWGGAGVENYFTIMNNDNNWIQGHLRFRGAVWCGELLDMDIILSPGDVFVFRVADLDGDGFWEIDQSLDPKNFEYTGMLASCGPEVNGVTPSATIENCRDQSSILIPAPDNNDTPKGNITQEKIDHHRRVGQIEFIGEGVFLPRSVLNDRMKDLINPVNKGKYERLGQRRTGNDLGTHLWSWVDGYDAYPNCDTTNPDNDSDSNSCKTGLFAYEQNDEKREAEDVGNVLSGTAFITKVGDSTGISYNADALVNFRTDINEHRVENYPKDTGVILHHEDSIANGSQSRYAYTYQYSESAKANEGSIYNKIQGFEGRISFANTWGPSLADGDDYKGTDTWDSMFSHVNSIDEVNEAVLMTQNKSVTARQNFTGFYMDGATFGAIGKTKSSGLTSSYFSFAPTKFFSGERENLWYNSAKEDAGYNKTGELLGKRGYLTAAVNRLINVGKHVNLEVWDIFENTPRFSSDQECVVSPCIADETVIKSSMTIMEQVAYLSINNIKDVFGKTGTHQNWNAGRVVMTVKPSENGYCDGDVSVRCPQNYAVMMYTFDMSPNGSVSQWRPMHRGFSREK